MDKPGCLFCDHSPQQHRILFVTEHWWVRFDNFPVNPGHVEIVPQRHLVNIDGLNQDEWRELPDVIARTKQELKELGFNYDGNNIGINDGLTAGQTIMHLHIHLIPRYDGDVPNPRGGVRNIKPPIVAY